MIAGQNRAWRPVAYPHFGPKVSVITTGRYAYRDEDGVAVVPAALLGP